MGTLSKIKRSSSPRINGRLGEGQVDQQINQKVTAMMLMEVKEECWETCTSPCMLQDKAERPAAVGSRNERGAVSAQPHGEIKRAKQ